MTQPPTLDYVSRSGKPSSPLANVAFGLGLAACLYSIYGWIDLNHFTFSVTLHGFVLCGIGAMVGVISRLVTGRRIAFVGLLLSIIAGGIMAAEYIFVVYLIAKFMTR